MTIISTIFTARRIGMLLYVTAVMAVIDWCLGELFIRGYPAIVELILYGEIYERGYPRFPFGLMFLPCPGNGFAFYCSFWWFSLLGFFALSSCICLYVNLTRLINCCSDREWTGFSHSQKMFMVLSVLISVLLLLVFIWGWADLFGLVQHPGWLEPIYRGLELFIHFFYLFASIVAGRYLRRNYQPG